jgi:hypothetical protein
LISFLYDGAQHRLPLAGKVSLPGALLVWLLLLR